jgi:hypothetical protein
MSDPFSDYNLMSENLDKINRGDVLAVRVSAEHYLWLCSARSTISAITHTAGGEVEGHPTSVINILQRIRQLVEIERMSSNEDPSDQRREPMNADPRDDEKPF